MRHRRIWVVAMGLAGLIACSDQASQDGRSLKREGSQASAAPSPAASDAPAGASVEPTPPRKDPRTPPDLTAPDKTPDPQALAKLAYQPAKEGSYAANSTWYGPGASPGGQELNVFAATQQDSGETTQGHVTPWAHNVDDPYDRRSRSLWLAYSDQGLLHGATGFSPRDQNGCHHSPGRFTFLPAALADGKTWTGGGVCQPGWDTQKKGDVKFSGRFTGYDQVTVAGRELKVISFVEKVRWTAPGTGWVEESSYQYSPEVGILVGAEVKVVLDGETFGGNWRVTTLDPEPFPEFPTG